MVTQEYNVALNEYRTAWHTSIISIKNNDGAMT